MPFTDNLSPRDQKQVDQLRKIILAADPAVIEEPGPIMSANLIYSS